MVSRVKGSEEERTWPGRIFEREDLSYSEAMDRFIAARRTKEELAHADAGGAQVTENQKAQRQALRSASWRLQLAREEERERRRLSDRAWKVLEEEQRAAVLARAAPERPRGLPSRAAWERDWRAHWAQRHQELEKGRGFVRVPLVKHRPRSNGIAERFIETLQAWLADREWQTAEELERLLAEFLADYNKRPHQGYELAGLPPNEYAARLGVM